MNWTAATQDRFFLLAQKVSIFDEPNSSWSDSSFSLWAALHSHRLVFQAELESLQLTRDKLSSEHLFTDENGGKIGNLELANTVKMLQGQRVQVQKELAKLDKAIAVLRELSGTSSTPSQNGKRRTLSAAARRKIAKAQKARWAKLRAERKAKA